MARVPRLLPWLLILGACEAETRPHLPPRQEGDKAKLYGDPSLVPTVEGERIRREVALAGEMAKALRMFPVIDDVAVDVELPNNAQEVPRVTITGRLTATEPTTPPDDETRAVVRGILGEPVQIETVWLRGPSAPAPDRPHDPWTLFAALGLGISLGVTAERLAGRRAHRSGSRAIPRTGIGPEG